MTDRAVNQGLASDPGGHCPLRPLPLYWCRPLLALKGSGLRAPFLGVAYIGAVMTGFQNLGSSYSGTIGPTLDLQPEILHSWQAATSRAKAVAGARGVPCACGDSGDVYMAFYLTAQGSLTTIKELQMVFGAAFNRVRRWESSVWVYF